jgi:hypothetical protein
MFRPSNLLPVQLFVTCLTLLLLTLQACSTDSGPGHPFTKGNGTEENPFWISDIHQLQAIGDTLYLDSHFIQVRDIDASESADFQNGLGFNEIGNAEHPFTGSYNGGGFVIRDLHLHMNVEDKTNGLFGYLKNATLKNITIDNSNQLNQKSLTSRQSRLQKQQTISLQQIIGSGISENQGNGGLAGINDEGVVLNCHFKGFVGGELSQSLAGLIGINKGVIEDSSFKGIVSGGSAIGLVSWNLGEIRSSRVSADLSGQTGYGFVRVNEGIVIRSSANVDIFEGNAGAGFVGTNSLGRIESSYATGTLKSRFFLAGFALNNRGDILNSYSHVSIEAIFSESNPDLNNVGGFVTENEQGGIIKTSFAAGSITLDPPNEMFLSGGIAVKNFGEIHSTYWDRQLTGLKDGIGEGSGDGVIGLTTSQMTGPAAQEHMPEFDWVNIWATTPDGYPVLRWQVEE